MVRGPYHDDLVPRRILFWYPPCSTPHHPNFCYCWGGQLMPTSPLPQHMTLASPFGRFLPLKAQSTNQEQPRILGDESHWITLQHPHLLRKLPCTSQCYRCRNQASVAHSNSHGASIHLSLDFRLTSTGFPNPCLSRSPPSWGLFFPQTNHLHPSPHLRLGF